MVSASHNPAHPAESDVVTPDLLTDEQEGEGCKEIPFFSTLTRNSTGESAGEGLGCIFCMLCPFYQQKHGHLRTEICSSL